MKLKPPFTGTCHGGPLDGKTISWWAVDHFPDGDKVHPMLWNNYLYQWAGGDPPFWLCHAEITKWTVP